jgi:hypothetical protein
LLLMGVFLILALALGGIALYVGLLIALVAHVLVP